ncbi:MAG: D-tyrosyl-tRNA(Tyr) deacylase [Clostridia bacterium]|nr:D-tyrosyl-tRNA(Tyr) deacylase [Clostridia bacterium]
MTVVLERVTGAEVKVDGEVRGRCGKGLLLFVGVFSGDGREDAELLAKKIAALRIFSDSDGKMNLSAKDVGGSALAIPNFTIAASYRKGNRPDFMNAAPPEEAKELFDLFADLLGSEIPTERGVFGADMKVASEADGPVTICLESGVLRGKRRS